MLEILQSVALILLALGQIALWVYNLKGSK